MGEFWFWEKWERMKKYNSKIWDTTFNSSIDALSLFYTQIQSIIMLPMKEMFSVSCLLYISFHAPQFDITQIIFTMWWGTTNNAESNWLILHKNKKSQTCRHIKQRDLVTVNVHNCTLIELNPSFIHKIKKMKIENCTISIPKENHTVATRTNLIRRTNNRNWHTNTVSHPSINRG